MGNYEFKNSNNKNYNNQLKNIKEEEIIIELEIKISHELIAKEINILCDKNQLIKDKKRNENLFKKNNLNPPKIFEYFNKENTKLYLNDNEIIFNYKLNFNKVGINKIVIKSYTKLSSLSSMFYNCVNINKIKFIKINTNNVIDMSFMFYHCDNLYDLDLSSFNTNNVIDMSWMFYYCEKVSGLNLTSFNTNNVTNLSWMFSNCRSLSEIDLSSFNTNKVTNMSYIFSMCSNLMKLL